MYLKTRDISKVLNLPQEFIPSKIYPDLKHYFDFIQDNNPAINSLHKLSGSIFHCRSITSDSDLVKKHKKQLEKHNKQLNKILDHDEFK